ncbi:hypothetical protein YTPLAS72_26250 [Nitrospira sp.]|nr:hypothetical protein YTPLAS72_26250 [Nitrospira sp.]
MTWLRYNGGEMKEMTTGDLAIGVFAGLGVVVLLVLFVYVVKQIIVRKD